MKIKKGDHVIVLAGKDKGATGTVIAAYPDRDKVLVQGVNMIKKNKKVQHGCAWRAGRRHHHPGGADPREQRVAGRS